MQNMNKLEKLFAAARKEKPPVPAEGFEFVVMQAIKRKTPLPAVTVFDQLNVLFPRLTGAAVVIIALCVAGDWLAGGAQTNLTDGVTQLSQQWLLTGNGF
jgi:hypothetical protein